MNRRVRKIDTFGIISTVAGTGVSIYSGDGVPATTAGIGPLALGIDKRDKLYISDSNQRIRMVDTFGIIHTVVGTGIAGYNGDGILATSAQIYTPMGIAFDACGNMYFEDEINYRIRKVAFNPFCNPSTLETKQIKPLTEISISPNPATTTLTVSAPGNIKEVLVYNLLGQITVWGAEKQCGAREVQIDVSQLPPGMHLLRIIMDDGSVAVKRFVKE